MEEAIEKEPTPESICLTTSPDSDVPGDEIDECSASSLGLEDPREKRFAANQARYDRLRHYFKTGRHLAGPGMNAEEARNIRNNSKKHKWDEVRQVLYYTGGKPGVRREVICDMHKVDAICLQFHNTAVGQLGAHSGINNTLTKVSQLYSWRGMKQDVMKCIMSCMYCKKTRDRCTKKPRPKSPPTITSKEPLDIVAMELIGPHPASNEGYRYVLVFTDHCTKFVELIPLYSREAIVVANGIKRFVCRWGAPRQIYFDQSCHFVSQVNRETARLLRLIHPFVAAVFPEPTGHQADQPNGDPSNSDDPAPPDLDVAHLVHTYDPRFTTAFTDDSNQVLKVCIKRLITLHKNDWNRYLEEVAYCARTQQPSTDGFSPFHLMFGRLSRSIKEQTDPALNDDFLEETSVNNPQKWLLQQQPQPSRDWLHPLQNDPGQRSLPAGQPNPPTNNPSLTFTEIYTRHTEPPAGAACPKRKSTNPVQLSGKSPRMAYDGQDVWPYRGQTEQLISSNPESALTVVVETLIPGL